MSSILHAWNRMDMATEKRVLLDTFRSPEVLPILSCIEQLYKSSKNAELSVFSRKQGNALFHKTSHDRQTHIEIFKFYCKSIAFAPNDSTELAFGYGNRSAFLFHVKKYQACIEDINKALSIHRAENFMKKLLDRKALCLEALQLSNNSNELSIQSSPTCATNVEIEDLENDSYTSLNKEMSDIFEDVDIRYSEKYGRHLIANQDFKPGDIVFVEKIYSQIVTTPWTHTNCSHCLKICWSGIPCDHCKWSMFCSEGCKSEAWKKYHEIECPIVSVIKTQTDKLGYYLPIRTLIIGLNEAGSLKKLEDEIASLDPTIGCWHGFKSDDKFLKNRFHSVNSLSCHNFTRYTQELSLFEIIAFTLTVLAKETTIFGKKFESVSSENLENIPGAIFLGLILAKLTRNIVENGFFIKNSQVDYDYANNEREDEYLRKIYCFKGQCVAPIAGLINHSCDPNVAMCFTEDGKIAFVALSPIRKNSQIFRCYYIPFAKANRASRQMFLAKRRFVCSCIACEQNWTVSNFLYSHSEFKESVTPSQVKIFKKCLKIVVCSLIPGADLEMDIEEAISILSKSIMKLFKISTLPSSFICMLMQSLDTLFNVKYGSKMIDLEKC